MHSDNSRISTSRWFETLLSAVFAAAVVSSAWILWQHGVPVFFSSTPAHSGHRVALDVHVIGGASMLVLGATTLFVGWSRYAFRWHRWFGYGYLCLGSVGAISAMHLSVMAPHEPKSLYVATGTLSATWIAVAAMAFRAALNRRFEVHREWMIRSYVLSWTFVGCRLAENYSVFPSLGQEGVTATVWLGWLLPLFICEFVIQWKHGSRKK